MEKIAYYEFRKIENGFICTYTNVINGKNETKFYKTIAEIYEELKYNIDLLGIS